MSDDDDVDFKDFKELREALKGEDEFFKGLRRQDLAEAKKNFNKGFISSFNEDLNLINNHSLSKIMNEKTGNTLLDKVLSNKDPRILEAIKSKPVNVKEIDEWRDLKLKRVDPESYGLLRECLLARCFYQKFENGVCDLYTAEIVNKDSLFMGPSFLETAVENEVTGFCLTCILLKIMKVDESWKRAEEIARKKDNVRNLNFMTKRKNFLIKKEKKGMSRLDIAVIENDPEMIEYIMNIETVHKDEAVKNEGAALSLSYSMGHMECVKSLQNNKVNVNIFDKLNQSPLHVAINYRRQEHVDYLVDHMEDLEARDFMNFTVLERAVMNDCEYITERLVKKGARCDKEVEIYSKYLNMDPDLGMILYNTPHLPITECESIYTLCFKVNKTLYPALLDTFDHNTALTDGDGNTLLHLSAMSLNIELCSKLISKQAKVDLINKDQRTPLLELLIKNKNKYFNEIEEVMTATVYLLIDAGASVNVKDLNENTVLRIVTEYHNEKLLLSLIHKREVLQHIERSTFMTWVEDKHYTFIKEVLPLINKSLVEQWVTEDIIDICIRDDALIAAKSLYDKACCNVKMNIAEVLLQNSAINEYITIFEEVINQDIAYKSSLEGGESLLSYLIKKKKEEFIGIVIRSRNSIFFLEKENNDKKLPLHVCLESEYWEVIDRLITDTKSVDKEDNDGNTPLSLLLTKISDSDNDRLCNRLMAFVKTLILKSADIYKVIKDNKTAITFCTKTDLALEVERFFCNHNGVYQATKLQTSSTIYAEAVEECTKESAGELNEETDEGLHYNNSLDNDVGTVEESDLGINNANISSPRNDDHNVNDPSSSGSIDTLLSLLPPPIDD